MFLWDLADYWIGRGEACHVGGISLSVGIEGDVDRGNGGLGLEGCNRCGLEGPGDEA